MDKGLYFGSGSENTSKITNDRQNTDKPNGFVFGQPGKGYGIHADAQPSGMAFTARREMESALQSVSETVVIIDPELQDVICRIKPKYVTAIQGSLCCIREQHEQQVTVDIIESNGFRRCTIPLECIEIPEHPRTISDICTEIHLCMKRYLDAEHPVFLQTEDA